MDLMVLLLVILEKIENLLMSSLSLLSKISRKLLIKLKMIKN